MVPLRNPRHKHRQNQEILQNRDIMQTKRSCKIRYRVMRVALNCSKDTTTPDVQLSRLHNKRVQNEAGGSPREFPRMRGTAVYRGRSGWRWHKPKLQKGVR